MYVYDHSYVNNIDQRACKHILQRSRLDAVFLSTTRVKPFCYEYTSSKVEEIRLITSSVFAFFSFSFFTSLRHVLISILYPLDTL